MRRRLFVVVGALVLVVGGCSPGEEKVTGGATTTTTVPPVADVVLPPPFAMSREEIVAASVIPMTVAVDVAEGLDTTDEDLFQAQFAPGARVTDPLVPNLRPTVGDFFSRYQSLCSWEYEEVFVNEGGSLTRGTCTGLLDTVAGAPSSPGLVRHMQMQDVLSTGFMHRIDAEILAAHPIEIVEAIGFPDLGMTTVHLAAAEQADQANRFEETFVKAWNTGDPDEIVALYTPNAIRHDEFAGLAATSPDFLPWLETIHSLHDTMTVTVEQLYASGLGPAAVYRLDAASGDSTCTMRIGSIWNLTSDDLITYEQVLYDPDTIFNCDWDT